MFDGEGLLKWWAKGFEYPVMWWGRSLSSNSMFSNPESKDGSRSRI